MGYILLIIAAIAILAIIGLGWQTFFAGVQKGADKVGISPIVRNLTGQAKQSVNGIVKDVSSSIVNSFMSTAKNTVHKSNNNQPILGNLSNKTRNSVVDAVTNTTTGIIDNAITNRIPIK